MAARRSGTSPWATDDTTMAGQSHISAPAAAQLLFTVMRSRLLLIATLFFPLLSCAGGNSPGGDACEAAWDAKQGNAQAPGVIRDDWLAECRAELGGKAAAQRIPTCADIKTGQVLSAEDWSLGCRDGEKVLLAGFYSCRDGRRLYWTDHAWGYADAPTQVGKLPGDEVTRCKS